MSDIVEFIKARIDEDERAALEWPERRRRWVDDGATIYSGHATDLIADWVYEDRGSEHIARHDPARVLAEVAAKRQMLAHIVIVTQSPWPIQVATAYQEDLKRLLRLMARPYADHPDFDQQWAAGLYPTVETP